MSAHDLSSQAVMAGRNMAKEMNMNKAFLVVLSGLIVSVT